MKYAPPQIIQLAQMALAAQRANDQRYVLLVINLAARVGLPPAECEARIQRLAQGRFS